MLDVRPLVVSRRNPKILWPEEQINQHPSDPPTAPAIRDLILATETESASRDGLIGPTGEDGIDQLVDSHKDLMSPDAFHDRVYMAGHGIAAMLNAPGSA